MGLKKNVLGLGRNT